MTATLVREKVETKEEKRPVNGALKRLLTVGTLPKGYLPDDDDPAWPSKSGQAD